jgi:phosphoribosyl-ATP pyrophosphohydrolase
MLASGRARTAISLFDVDIMTLIWSRDNSSRCRESVGKGAKEIEMRIGEEQQEIVLGHVVREHGGVSVPSEWTDLGGPHLMAFARCEEDAVA